MTEVWSVIPRYAGKYEASSSGLIRNAKTKRVLKKCDNGKGYEFVSLMPHVGKKKPEKVHRLVAEAFLNNPLNYEDVNHINGIKNDNRVENLEWLSKKQNHKHAAENGLKAAGERCGRSKLIECQVKSIRELYSSGLSQRSIGRQFHISRGAVEAIVNRVTWKNVA